MTPKEIRFYKSTGKYAFLSNLYPCRMVWGGKVYRSSEHAYQAQKANKKEIEEWIVAAPYPRLAAIAGHGLASYDVVPLWNDVPVGGNGLPDEARRHKVVLMRSILLMKFHHNYDLATKLLETEDAILIEDSKVDPFWGIGRNGKGQNWLGKCLMDIREMVRKKREEIERRHGEHK